MTLQDHKGFTLIELLIVVAIISIIAAIAIPNVIQSRMTTQEVSAIGSLKSIRDAQALYSAGCSNGGYATTLDDLAKPPTGSNVGFISPDLSTNGITKSGYIVTLAAAAGASVVTPAANTCNASSAAAVSGYFAHAEPVNVGSTGVRSFAVDTRGSVFQQTQGTVIPDPPTAGGTISIIQ